MLLWYPSNGDGRWVWKNGNELYGMNNPPLYKFFLVWLMNNLNTLFCLISRMYFSDWNYLNFLFPSTEYFHNSHNIIFPFHIPPWHCFAFSLCLKLIQFRKSKLYHFFLFFIYLFWIVLKFMFIPWFQWCKKKDIEGEKINTRISEKSI